MPFRSEKQRRYLWAKHPEIAKEWAHKYPDSNKGLPMYAHDKTEEDKPVSKEAAITALNALVVNNLNSAVKSIFASACDKNTKKADSKLEQIKLPQDDKPTYAGERKLESILKPETEDEGSIGQERNVNHTENTGNMQSNPLLSKLAVVLAPKIQQEIENIRAQQEARDANRMPQNVNIKKYPVQNFNVPPPMGMTAPQAPQAPQQQPAQPPAQANGQMPPVGGGQSPNANPINSFGGLSSTGDINGNAALGTQNMAGGEKMAAQKCSCGCGQKVNECTCPPSCSCRQKGGSCYGLKKQAGGNSAALAQLTGIHGYVQPDADELDELEEEMCSKTAAKDPNFNLVYPSHKTNYVMPKHLRENVLKPSEAAQVLQAMRSVAPHGALDDTRLDWHGLKIRGYGSRVENNDRITNLGRWLHHTVGDEFEATHPDKTQGFGDAFLPYANIVTVPSGMGGTLMHELGHAADFNGFPADSSLRHLGAATYRRYAPILWKEHAAWSKGRRGILSAFANKELDPKLTHKILTNAAGAKRLGLGSYWGGAIGGTLGGAAGVAGLIALSELARKNNMNVQFGGRTAALPVVLGATLGIAGGTGIGHLMSRQPVKSEKIVRLMAKALSKKQRIPYAEAQQYIQSALAENQKPVQRRKAAGAPAWQRSEGKNEEGGLNEKGRKSYEREHGGNLKAPVTESNPSGERAKRQNSFCSRMCGMKRVNTGAGTAKDPDSRINKSLRKWNCKCSSALDTGLQKWAGGLAG